MEGTFLLPLDPVPSMILHQSAAFTNDWSVGGARTRPAPTIVRHLVLGDATRCAQPELRP